MSQPQPHVRSAPDPIEGLSAELGITYAVLDARVAELAAQLARTHRARGRELAENRRLADRLQALLEALPAAVVLVDGRGRVDAFNPAAEGLFPTLAWGRRWPEVRDEQLAGVSDNDEWLLHDGRRLNVSCRPLGEAGQVLVLVDVTETHRLQAELERNERLGALGEMAAQLAHQVRTPLSAALLYAGQLGRDDLDGEQRRGFSDKLLARLRHTERLVADMLAYARGGRFLPEPVELNRLLREAADTLAPRLQAAGARLALSSEVEESALVLGNRDALGGALINLLDNALVHGREGLQVTLGLSARGEGYCIRVCDDGDGVPEALRERIFDPFFTTRSGGTGLGLAVVRAVIDEHHGEIHCRPRTQGACFEILLPRFTAGSHP